MANIFGGISLNPPAQVGFGGDDLTSNFIAGMRSRREDEDMQMRRAQEARAQIQHHFATQESYLRMKQLENTINTQNFKNNLEMDAYKLMGPAQLAFSAVSRNGNWANPVEWLNFLDANPNARFLPIAQEASKLMQAAIDDEARLNQIREINAGKAAVSGLNQNETALEANIRLLKEAEAAGDVETANLIRRQIAGRDDRTAFQKDYDFLFNDSPPSFGSAGNTQDVIRRRFKFGPTVSAESSAEKSIAAADRAISEFESLLSGNRLNRSTVGPVAYLAENLIDPVVSFFDESAYERLGGAERTAVRTELRKATLASVRQIIDDVGNLTASERALASKVASGIGPTDTPAMIKQKLSVLVDMFKKARQRLQKNIDGEKESDALMDQLRGMQRDSAEARALAEKIAELRKKGL